MAKRFATIFFIMIGVVVFLLSAFMLVLFLAPGLSVFGIKYITINTHGVNTGKVKITETLNQIYGSSDFSGSIIINSKEVPVIVEFTAEGQRNDYYYQYYDNYSGITKSDIDDPSIAISKDAQGNAVFTVNSFETFVFQNGNSQRFIKLFIPLSYISVTEYAGKQEYIYGDSDPGAAGKYTTNLTINSETASVQFYNNDASRAPAFNNLKIKTTGIVSYNNNHIKAMTFDYETDETIKLGSSVYAMANAKNYIFTSTNGRVIVERELLGDLIATTNYGDITVNRCNNLTVRSDLGGVRSSIEDRGITVRGIVNIKTSAGSVDINEILGTGQNKIETGSGSVVINQIKNGEIITHRGSVTIKSVNNVTISTNMGNVKIEEVLESVDVSTKRGKIKLGDTGMVLKSVKVSSRLGDISVIDAIGDVYLESISSDIDFINKNSQNIKIYAGGDLNARNLKGLVDISVNKTAYLEFDTISNATKILVNKDCSYIKIDALSVIKTNLNYKLAGNPVSIYESNNTGYATYSLIETKDYIANSNQNGIKFEIAGNSDDGQNSAKIDIYFNKSTDY